MESLRNKQLASGLLALLLLAGCTTVAERRSGKDREFAPGPMRIARLPPPEMVGSAADASGEVQQVQFVEEESPTLLTLPVPPTRIPPPEVADDGEVLPPSETPVAESFPIDLPTALRLAGANNLQIAFAAEQVQQALARVDAADVLWVPSLNAGVVYNNHAGRIQATPGEVIEASRNSLFVGAGAGTANAPVAAGSGGPARMFVDLALVDVLFEPLAARQVAQGAQANRVATFNDALLATATAYLDLVRARAMVVVSEEAVANATQLSRLTEDFARSGRGLQADADRARAELASRRRDVFQVQEEAAVASAELARLLRLDPATGLIPADTQPVSLRLFEHNSDVYDLIGQAHAIRPELTRACASVQETWYRTRQEHWRPYVPHLYAGFSGGGFGGAPGSSVESFSDRTDFDVAAVWQAQNLGLGNRARRMEQDSLHRQAHVVFASLTDQIAAEVTQAFEQVRYRGQQITVTENQVRSATEALKLNLLGIRGGVLRPIEIQQAISALADARRQYLDAVINHNRAQFALLRAIGQPATKIDGVL